MFFRQYFVYNEDSLPVSTIEPYKFQQKLSVTYTFQGRIQDFKLGGAHLKKLHRAEGDAKMFGVFRAGCAPPPPPLDPPLNLKHSKCH